MKKRIVCFGDSNTWGYNAETKDRFDDDTRWTGVLAKELGQDYTVIEEGLGGRTTVFEDPVEEGRNGLVYLYPCLMSHGPIDLLIVMLGTNDCKERYSATAGNIARGMARLIEKAKQTEAWRNAPNILLIAPGPIEKECETIGVLAKEMGICSDKSYELAAAYEEVAKLKGCHFLDAGKIAQMSQLDYIHLDREGHKLLGKALAERIPALL